MSVCALDRAWTRTRGSPGRDDIRSVRANGHVAQAELAGLRLLALRGAQVHRDEVGVREGHTLTKQQTIDALRSPDCRAELNAISSYCPRARRSESGSGDGGCSTSGVVDPNGSTLQILLAIVGTVVARRLARRARSQ